MPRLEEKKERKKDTPLVMVGKEPSGREEAFVEGSIFFLLGQMPRNKEALQMHR